MPANLLNYLDRYSKEHNPSKNLSVVESFKTLREKISECEELQTFVSSNHDKELTDIAVQDIEAVSNDIQHIVDSVRDELGGLSQLDLNIALCPCISQVPGVFCPDEDLCDSVLLSAEREV